MKIGLIAAVGSLLALYFASGSPIPLYSMYQSQLDLTHAELSMTSVYYLVGTVLSFVFFPRLSDHLGRRPVTLAILALAFAACAIFANLQSASMLMAGRFLQGIVSGLGSSTIAAYVVDLCTGLPRWVGPAITSSAPTLGLSTGAFVSGGSVQYLDVPPEIFFTAIMVGIAVLALLVILGAETRARAPGTVKSVIPRVCIPKGAGRLFAASAMAFVGTWAIGGFSQSFSSAIVTEYFGYRDAFLSATVFTSLLLPNVIGSFLARRFDVRLGQITGMGVFAASAVLMYVSLSSGSLPFFLIFSVVAGVFQGIAFTASVTELLTRAGSERRAGMFSTIYLTSYGGAAIPNLVVGMIPGEFTTVEILSWYVALTVIMAAVMFVLAAKPYPKTIPSE